MRSRKWLLRTTGLGMWRYRAACRLQALYQTQTQSRLNRGVHPDRKSLLTGCDDGFIIKTGTRA
jgi:hypothetical protein